MGDYDQRLQSGLGVGTSIPLNGEKAELQLTIFPLELGTGSQHKQYSLFNRASLIEYRFGYSREGISHFLGVRFGIGKIFRSDFSSYGIDARFGVNQNLDPVVALEFHLMDSERSAAPGIAFGIEAAVGEKTEAFATLALRWAFLKKL